MPGSITSNVVDSNLLQWFWLIWAAHNNLHPSDPTKCRAEASNHEYSALLLMLMHGWAYPMIFYAYGYCSVSTFHCLSSDDTKNVSFSAIEAAVHIWWDTIQCFSASTCTALNVLTFEPFLMLSNVPELLCDQLLMILQVELAPDMIFHEVMPPILCLQTFFGVPEHSLS